MIKEMRRKKEVPYQAITSNLTSLIILSKLNNTDNDFIYLKRYITSLYFLKQEIKKLKMFISSHIIHLKTQLYSINLIR